MFARLTPRLVCSVLIALSGGLISLQVRADQDHERAHQARLAGKIKPLSAVLQELAQQQPGQVLEVELEHEDDRWIYEIKLLAPDGRVHKLHVDAAAKAAVPARKEQ